MGDRICLTFVNGEARSPVLYAHWDGKELLDRAGEFWEMYRGLIRTEPANWMVNFIIWLRDGDVIDGNYYLYPDEERSCSPDDHGFWEFDTSTGECRQTRRGDYE